MDEPGASRELRRLITAIVDEEGPISWTLCAQRVRDAFGARRMGTQMHRAFHNSVHQLLRRGELHELEKRFLAIAGRTIDAVRVPVRGVGNRAPDDISRAELELALKLLISDARSITEDELTTRVARLFGWNRRGPGIAAAMEQALANLTTRGTIERTGITIRSSDPR